MRFTQKIAEEFARFIDRNYIVPNMYPNASVASIPIVGETLSIYFKKISDMLFFKMGDPELKEKKIKSAVRFCQVLVEFSKLKLDGQHETPQQTPEKIKIILRNFLNQYVDENLYVPTQNQELAAISAASTSSAATTAKEKAENADDVMSRITKFNTATAANSVLGGGGALVSVQSNAIDKKIADDKLQKFYQSLDAISTLSFSEVHFMRLLYILIENESKKIEKIEEAHEKTEGSYDVALEACQFALKEMCHLSYNENATYVTTGLSRPNKENAQDPFVMITDRYCRSKKDLLMQDLPGYLTEVFVEQFLAAAISCGEYQYNLNTLMPAVALPFPASVQQGCIIIDSKIRGDKRAALNSLTLLMKENLTLVESYVVDAKRSQKLLQSVLYSISYIGKETGFSLTDLTASVINALIKIKHRAPIVSNSTAETQNAAQSAAMGSVSIATPSNNTATLYPKFDQKQFADASNTKESNTDTKQKQEQERQSLQVKQSISRGRKKTLSTTERINMIGVNVNQVSSFIQRQAKECAVIIDETCIEEPVAVEFGGAELAESHFHLNHTSICIPLKLGSGERISAADLFFEVLNGLLVNDKNWVNNSVLEQDPEYTSKQLQDLFSSEIARISKILSEKEKFPFAEGCYPAVLKGCLKFLSDISILNPYSDWYLQAKLAEKPNPIDFFLINLMEEYLKLRREYCLLNMMRDDVEFSVDFDIPETDMDTKVIDQISVVFKESLEDLMSELGENSATVMITYKNLLYCLKDIASKNAVNLNGLFTKFEKDLITNAEKINASEYLVPFYGEYGGGAAANENTKIELGYFPSGGLATLSKDKGALKISTAASNTATTTATATASSNTAASASTSAAVATAPIKKAPASASATARATMTLSHSDTENLQGSIPLLNQSMESGSSATPLIASIESFTREGLIAHSLHSGDAMDMLSDSASTNTTTTKIGLQNK